MTRRITSTRSRLSGTSLVAVLLLGAAPQSQTIRGPVNASVIATEFGRVERVARSRHYEVHTDLPEAEARRAATTLDAAVDAIHGIFRGLKDRSRKPLVAYLVSTQERYAGVLAHRYGTDTRGTGGISFEARGQRIIASFGPSGGAMGSTLQHEAFHQIRSGYLDSIPPWLDEGLAEVLGKAIIEPTLAEGRAILGELPAQSLLGARQAIESGQALRVGQMLSLDGDDWSKYLKHGSAGPNYRVAWLMVHYLLFGDAGRHRRGFEAAIAAMNGGMSWQAAFAKHLNITQATAAELDDALRRYASSIAPTDLRESILRLEFLAEGAKSLHTRGTALTTFDEFRAELIKRAFVAPAESPAARRAAADPNQFVSAGGTTESFLFRAPSPERLNEAKRVRAKLTSGDADEDKKPSKSKRAGRTSREPQREEKKTPEAPPPAAATDPESFPLLPPDILSPSQWPVRLEVRWALDPKSGELVHRVLAEW